MENQLTGLLTGSKKRLWLDSLGGEASFTGAESREHLWFNLLQAQPDTADLSTNDALTSADVTR